MHEGIEDDVNMEEIERKVAGIGKDEDLTPSVTNGLIPKVMHDLHRNPKTVPHLLVSSLGYFVQCATEVWVCRKDMEETRIPNRIKSLWTTSIRLL